MEPLDRSDLQALLSAGETAQLLQQLNTLSKDTIRQVITAATQGDHSQVQRLLQPVLTADTQKLAQALEKRLG